MLKNWIVYYNGSIEKRSTIWNMCSGVLNAAQSALLLLIVTRCCGIIDAGVFSIATTIGYQMIAIGNYGMRNFQATDIQKKYSFKEYIASRYFTAGAMIIFLVVYLLVKGYEADKMWTIFFFCLFKGVDVIEDVIHGEFQRNNRLDIGAICSTIRYVFSFGIFIVMLMCGINLTVACLVTALASFSCFVVLTFRILKPRDILVKNVKYEKVSCLINECFPLFIGNFLYLYINSAPKYTIDNILGSEKQTYFGVLFMPAFFVNLVSDFIYRPLLTEIAMDWNSRNIGHLIKMIIRQIFYIYLITIIGVIAAKLVGIELLSAIYGLDLTGYTRELVILMVGGGFVALTGFMGNIMITMRKQKILFVCYFGVAVIAAVCSDYLVKNMELFGAALLYLALSSMMGMAVALIVLWFIYRVN